ncbi:MAG: FAD-dependent oxidoreductase [Candidatus Velthaea sp.]
MEALIARYDYDLLVLGGGAAGLVAAVVGAKLGAKTGLIEADRTGGDCTWHGCIPSKTLLRLAARSPRTAWADIRAELDGVRERIYAEADSPAALARFGVEVIAGQAEFQDPHRFRIGGSAGKRSISARFIVICTGSDPARPPHGGEYLTSDEIFDLPEQPQRLVIAGGGPVGVELAQAFARLGTSVDLVTSADRILPRDDADHARIIQHALEADGVRVRTGCGLARIEARGGTFAAYLERGSEIACDRVLVATGRVPRIAGFALERSGVATRAGAIAVDDRARTSVAHIFAAGDVTGPPYFTHAGEEMSKAAVANALLRWPKRFKRDRFPWCTFTDPELAHAGETEEQLRARGARYRVLAFPNGRLDRAVVDAEDGGGTKLFVGRRGRILGASIAGPRAGEVIGEVVLAMQARLPVSRIADTVHPYPSYSYGLRRACDEWYERALSPRVVGAIKLLFGYRG